MELKKIMGKAVLLCAVAFASVACSQDEFDEVLRPDAGKATLRLSAVGFTGEVRTRAAVLKEGEDKIKGVWVAQFGTDGKVIKAPTYYSTVNSDNTVDAELDTEASNVYAVANVPEDLFDSFDAKNGTEAQFKATTRTYTSEITCDGTSNFLPMVGVKAITADATKVEVPMTRAVARIDLTLTHDATTQDLKLTECYLAYVPNKSIMEAQTPGATRVYPSAADAQFYGYNATDEKEKFVYGKKSISLNAKGTSTDLSWYVPENLAGQNSDIQYAKHKGEKTAPDKYAMRIIVKGTCTYNTVPNTEVTFSIFPGQNATSDFNVQRNYVYTVTSTIKGVNKTDNRVTVHDYFDLSAEDTANSYMIHEGGKYKFKYTVPGNGNIFRSGTTLIDNSFNSTSLSGDKAEILWQGSGSSYLSGNTTTSVIKNVQFDNPDPGYISFETADTFAEGNALVALKSGTAVVWSWHIWATVYNPDDGDANVDKYTLNPTYATQTDEYVMRCNLGATGQGTTGVGAETTAPQCYGLIYQWGRKDPFYNTSTNAAPTTGNFTSNGAMLNLSIANPTTFYKQANTTTYDWYANAAASQNNYLWGNGAQTNVNITIVHGTSNATRVVNKQRGTKSAFDPCPVGWRVPPQALWTNCGITSVANNYVAKSGTTPAYLKLISNVGRNPVKYPAAGYLHRETGAVSNVGT
ncbi:MAG: DUF4906 domain-containing protein, partial [Alistipes senegalensis]|nr:DUF4906 domain-containing protein [Alistipes senegalensis]